MNKLFIWNETDPDCSQYLRRIDSLEFEMIEIVKLDKTWIEDNDPDFKQFIVVRGLVNVREFDNDTVLDLIDFHGYRDLIQFMYNSGDFAIDLLAEFYLEEELFSSDYIVYEGSNEDDAKNYIKSIVESENITT